MDHPSAPEPLQEKAESPHVSGSEAESMCLTPMESFSLISVSQLLFSPHLPPKFFCPIVKEMLGYYAERGDVQMAVSVLIVLGDRIRKEIDELTQVKRESVFRVLATKSCHSAPIGVFGSCYVIQTRRKWEYNRRRKSPKNGGIVTFVSYDCA